MPMTNAPALKAAACATASGSTPAAVYKRIRTAPPVSTPRPTVLPSAYAMNEVSRTVLRRTLRARVAQRREVVAGEHEIAERGREPRRQQVRGGLRRDLLHDLGVADFAQQAAQRIENERAEHEHDGADRPRTPPAPAACTLGRQALLLQQRERF